MAQRFRGFLPVVVDVETGGFDCNRHALLEIAAVPVEMDENGQLYPGQTASAHVIPAEGTEIDPKSLEITGIVLDHPFRLAKPERDALEHVVMATRDARRPIAMFTNDEDTSHVKDAVAAGVSAHIVAGLAPQRIRPILVH